MHIAVELGHIGYIGGKGASDTLCSLRIYAAQSAVVNMSQEIINARTRVVVLSAHLAGCQTPNGVAVKAQSCGAPAFARPVAVGSRFARPASHEAPMQCDEVKTLRLVQSRLSGPVYQPTKPGAYSSYAKRAAAHPRFARPCEKTEPVNSIPRKSAGPQLSIAETKSGYHMEMALPGLSANEVRLELQGGDLVIIGRQAVSGKQLASIRGLPFGIFKSINTMPNDIDAASVRADLVNGLLCIKARKQAQ